MYDFPKNRGRSGLPLMSLAMQLGAIEKQIRCYGTDVPIHMAEIHMIKAIKEMDGIHGMGLAEFFGITRGAVSQTLLKLERKGLVEKEPHSANLSRLRLKLSAKGETAYAHHEQLHDLFDQAVEAELSHHPDAFRETLASFLRSMQDALSSFNG